MSVIDLSKLQLIRPDTDLNEILFYIPLYQRGYRWQKDHVKTLLEDIIKCEDEIYCIQPLVVKSDEKGYIVADGQQRLTTLFLIYKALNIDVNFSFKYETRDEITGEYLRNDKFKEEEQAVNEVIDCLFIRESYKVAFAYNKNEELKKKISKVRFIWYPLSSDMKDQEYFDRLNMGRIPLTDAELIKALFLFDSQIKVDKQDIDQPIIGQLDISKHVLSQQEIAVEWDYIERRLHNDKFWYFLREFHSIDKQDYQVRIELILDLYAGTYGGVKNSSHKTFLWFEKQIEKDLSLWNKVYSIYAMLEEWYNDDEIFHFAGFLMSLKSSSKSRLKELKEFWNDSELKLKSEFKGKLLGEITKIVNEIGKSEKPLFDAEPDFISEYHVKLLGGVVKSEIKEMFIDSFGLSSLNFNDSSKKSIIYDILLLFNILELRPKNKEALVWANRFRFDLYKERNGKKQVWSLEHIHAQNNSKEKGEDEIHTIDNMALLTVPDNSSNSDLRFVAKKNNLRALDTKGSFIPQATKNIFMKYYSLGNSDYDNHDDWSEDDRRYYFLHMVYTFNDNLR